MISRLAQVGVSALLVALAASCTAWTATPHGVLTDQIVLTESGLVHGQAAEGVVSFKGIPYAAAPVGDLRWRAPQRAAAWTGVREATAFGNDCAQKPNPGDAAPLNGTMGEDCLYLNIWRPVETVHAEPVLAHASDSLPVLVSIHGGGYVNGGTSPAIYDGGEFAKKGVVVVSVNYRLGRFGFFAHPALTAAGEGGTGNFGYMDQVAALQWVQRNIGAFGGDAKNVTIIGESAGGEAVLHLLADPGARGLFAKVICLSGGGRKTLLPQRKLGESAAGLASAEEIGVNFAKENGIEGTGAGALVKLRALPASALVGDVNMDRLHAKPELATYVRGPIEDGVSIPRIIAAGKAAKVPLIIGSTSVDVGEEPPKDAPYSIFGADAEKAEGVYNPDGKRPAGQIRGAIAADRTMNEPARFVARQMTAAGNAVYLYRFSYIAESQRKGGGAYHASELPYLWGTLDARYGKEKVSGADRVMSEQFGGFMANFCKVGNPTAGKLPGSTAEWFRYEAGKADLMNFTNEGPVVQPDPFTARLDLVEKTQ